MVREETPGNEAPVRERTTERIAELILRLGCAMVNLTVLGERVLISKGFLRATAIFVRALLKEVWVTILIVELSTVSSQRVSVSKEYLRTTVKFVQALLGEVWIRNPPLPLRLRSNVLRCIEISRSRGQSSICLSRRAEPLWSFPYLE